MVSCGGSNVGSKVKPGELKASSALGGTCSTLGTATPLVVDMPDRAFLEGAMADGVVFVNYDCDTLTILDDCRLEGEYTYSGLSRAEELVTLENNDEVAANMMFTGGTAEANLQSGNALHIGLVRVGRKSTAACVARDQAEGSQCAQATHYIRQAVVGAFAMMTAQIGAVSGAVDVFAVGSGAASSTSAGSREARDGDLQACLTSKSTDEKPVEACQSLLRLSLAPVAETLTQRTKPAEKKGQEKAEEAAEESAEKAVVGEAMVCHVAVLRAGRCSDLHGAWSAPVIESVGGCIE